MATTDVSKKQELTPEQQLVEVIGPENTLGSNPAIDEQVNKLDAAVNLLLDGEGFKNYLSYKSKMHNYSWLNTMLIYFDFSLRGYDGPIVTMGRKGWMNQGRRLKDGAEPITLFKPVLQYWRHYYDENPRTNKVPRSAKWDVKRKKFYDLRSRAIGFELIDMTFHIQDTDGPEYDLPETVKLEGDEQLAEEIIEKLLATCAGLGVAKVVIEPRPYEEANGTYHLTEKVIWVEETMPKAQIAKTLTHELAHHMSHKFELDHHEVYRQTRDLAEACVEGAAFVVMGHFGIDTSSYSVPYIAQWAGQPNVIKRLVRDISKISDAIIRELDATDQANIPA